MGETGADTPLVAARTMLDIFASVGAERFLVTWTNSTGKPRRPRSLRKNLQSLGGPLPHTDNNNWLDAVHIAGIGAPDLDRTLPALLDTATADRLNLTIRLRGRGLRFIELPADKLPPLAAAMFLIIASGATKIAGILNFKDKYAPDFPRVRIRAAQPGRMTSTAELERMGLVAPAEIFAVPTAAALITSGA